MENENKEPIEQLAQDPVQDNQDDPWVAAFEKIAQTTESTAGGDDQDQNSSTDGNGTAADAGATPPAKNAQGDEASPASVPVDTGDAGGSGAPDTGTDILDDSGYTESEIKQEVESLTRELEERAMQEVAKAMVDRGIKHNGNQLGATINDSDIRKVDDDGTVTFYNPETGQPFTGDNPRRQAQEWVEDYNKELADTFNKVVKDRVTQLEAEAKPYIDLLKFAPVAQKLDPVRKALMEAIIEDYEIKDANGETYGYSCDLNQVLTQVNKQIAKIQSSQSPSQPGTASLDTPTQTSPVVDMPAGGGASEPGTPQFKSQAEALEYAQDQMLAKLREGKR